METLNTGVRTGTRTKARTLGRVAAIRGPAVIFEAAIFSSLSSGSGSVSSSLSSEASSIETKERRRATKTYRQCTPCPQDMMKKYTNFGIKWICAAYQRARRSFKSECMMRYRNCQDGTMFVKISDKRCRNSTYHGRHWFYIYRV
ncbi:uncharacterized protein LOC123700679 isoform X2 [Colias croceus]|uniref:uncharacterized protein LOC123700679 isoform X2 n=1 Tax=Colias crocea TaxID=72248 RepID=UPI001E28115B|nr:uncharacterized protein LOC123700679 isoform X2 [Colias croceus]